MKKFLIAAVCAALTLGVLPVHAKIDNGCSAADSSVVPEPIPAASPGGISCTYVAAATSATLITATPNAILITEKGLYDRKATVLYSAKAGARPPAEYTIATTPNKFVTIKVNPDTFTSVGGTPVTGAAGLVEMLETQ